jgi:hypothetical protein
MTLKVAGIWCKTKSDFDKYIRQEEYDLVRSIVACLKVIQVMLNRRTSLFHSIYKNFLNLFLRNSKV